ncbi:hypothetical protein N7522_010958 [Penicillium canescens]|nr:hypothetical protein N7522_010958 [Penicillium canescens]
MADPAISVAESEHTLNSPSREKVHVRETSSLSFLFFLRRTVKSFVGSVPFTDGERHHFTVELDSRSSRVQSPQPSPARLYSLLDSYFEATSGILDLFTANEIDFLISERPFSQDNTTHSPPKSDDAAALDVALAIGAQARGLKDDQPFSEACFSRARMMAFQDMLMSQSLGKIRLFILLAFYGLGACNRNSAAMFLAVAAKAAVILDLESSQDDETSEEASTRKRLWNSVRNLDILSSFIIGRPNSLPLKSQSAAKPKAFSEDESVSTQSTFAAMVDACIFLDNIVDTLGKNHNILHTPTAEDLLQELLRWSRNLPQNIRQFTSLTPSSCNLEPADRQFLMGSMHLSCVYYFAVILITRPFLVAYLTSRLRGKAPDHLINDPDQASDIKLKNNKVSRISQVCVSSAITMVDMCIKAKDVNFTFGNFCLIEAWLFGAGLVLGFSMFAGEPRKDIEDSFQNGCIILADIALSSPQAQLYYNILINFAEAVTKYRQRVADEMHHAVQHYLDRILVIEPTATHRNVQQRHNGDIQDFGKSWDDCLASNPELHTEADPRPMLQLPAFQDQQDFGAGGDILYSAYFSPDFESFDQLFYTIE